MIESALFSMSVVFAVWGIYHWLGYRLEKKKWLQSSQEMFGISQERKSFLTVMGDKFDQTRHGRDLSFKLKQVNLLLTASEFYSMLIVAAMALAYGLNAFFNIDFPIGITLAVIVISIVPQLLFYLRRNKYIERMNHQLPNVCRVLANATRSGMTLTQGINLAAQELNEPAKSEFQRLARELHLGVDFEQALQMLQKRLKSKEYSLFVVLLLTQKKAGGNLHATLEEMAQTLDDRKLLEQEIKTLTAEQRYVSYIVPSIPLFLVLTLNTMMDGFIDPLFSGIGILLLIVFIGGIAFSIFLVRKVTNIRV